MTHTKFYIIQASRAVKPIQFRGRSLADLKLFPATAKREAGYQLDQVQSGGDPDDWKPMPSIGPGVREIRISDAAGAFRIIYVAKFAEMVVVLHCFQKKSAKTSKPDLQLAKYRYQEVIKERQA